MTSFKIEDVCDLIQDIRGSTEIPSLFPNCVTLKSMKFLKFQHNKTNEVCLSLSFLFIKNRFCLPCQNSRIIEKITGARGLK